MGTFDYEERVGAATSTITTKLEWLQHKKLSTSTRTINTLGNNAAEIGPFATFAVIAYFQTAKS